MVANSMVIQMVSLLVGEIMIMAITTSNRMAAAVRREVEVTMTHVIDAKEAALVDPARVLKAVTTMEHIIVVVVTTVCLITTTNYSHTTIHLPF
jgi:hypothetical protein